MTRAISVTTDEAWKLDFGRGGLAKALTGFMAATDRFGFRPTFAVPRSILDRQSGLFQQVSAEGAELTVHDGTSAAGQPAAHAKYEESVRAAVDTFRKNDIPVSGLRTIGSASADRTTERLDPVHPRFDRCQHLGRVRRAVAPAIVPVCGQSTNQLGRTRTTEVDLKIIDDRAMRGCYVGR